MSNSSQKNAIRGLFGLRPEKAAPEDADARRARAVAGIFGGTPGRVKKLPTRDYVHYQRVGADGKVAHLSYNQAVAELKKLGITKVDEKALWLGIETKSGDVFRDAWYAPGEFVTEHADA